MADVISAVPRMFCTMKLSRNGRIFIKGSAYNKKNYQFLGIHVNSSHKTWETHAEGFIMRSVKKVAGNENICSKLTLKRGAIPILQKKKITYLKYQMNAWIFKTDYVKSVSGPLLKCGKNVITETVSQYFVKRLSKNTS